MEQNNVEQKIQEFIAVTNNLRDSYARNTKNKMDKLLSTY